MKRYVLSLILIAVLAFFAFIFVLTSFEPMDSLMHPPKAVGENLSIQLAFEEYAGDDYILKQPLSGKYKSAYTFIDITGDDENEAIVFYTKSNELGIVRMNVLDKVNDQWTSIADFKSEHSDIQQLEFSDLNGDGSDEIIVGWTAFQDNFSKRINVYEIKETSEGTEINVIFDDYYSMFLVEDFDNDDDNDILNVKYISAAGSAEYAATLYSYGKKSFMTRQSQIIIDKSISAVAQVVCDVSSDSVVRIYIDGYKADGGMATDCIFWNKERRGFLRFNYDSVSACALTSRTVNITCRDIDSDGEIEVPTESFLTKLKNNKHHSVSKAAQMGQSLITWVNLTDDGYNAEKTQIVIPAFGYSFDFDEMLQDMNITAAYNVKNSALNFYSLPVGSQNNETVLFSIITVDKNSNKRIRDQWIFISENQKYLFFAVIYDEAEEYGITKKFIKTRFNPG